MDEWFEVNYHPLKVKVAQLCPTRCNPIDYHRVHGILQARILEWVAVPFSRGSSQLRDQTQVSFISDKVEEEGLAYLTVKKIELQC